MLHRSGQTEAVTSVGLVEVVCTTAISRTSVQVDTSINHRRRNTQQTEGQTDEHRWGHAERERELT